MDTVSVCYCCGLTLTPSVQSSHYNFLSSRLKMHFTRSFNFCFKWPFYSDMPTFIHIYLFEIRCINVFHVFTTTGGILGVPCKNEFKNSCFSLLNVLLWLHFCSLYIFICLCVFLTNPGQGMEEVATYPGMLKGVHPGQFCSQKS